MSRFSKLWMRLLRSVQFSSCLGVLQNYTCDNMDALIAVSFSIRERRISAGLTGLELSDYSSVPNSPAVPDPADGRFPSPSAAGSPLSPPLLSGTSMASAKSMLAGVASSSAAKSLKNRLWGSRSASAQDFPDDISEYSAATAPATLEGGAAFSPDTRAASGGSPSAIPQRATAGTASLPASASTLFNKYASTLSQSDAAAALSKATTNSYIQAMQWKEAAPSTISKLRSDVEAKVAEAAGAAKTVIRPPSPNMDPPFTPPTAANGRWLSPDGMNSATSILGERRGSGPKPLLLSSSARRASNQLQDGLHASPSGGFASPSTSRRVSPGMQGSLGLGLPSSTSSKYLESPSYPLRSRTPSPTAGFRSLPASHSRATSASFGSYKIGAAGRNGSAEHSRAASLSTPTSLPPRAISPASSYHQLGGIPESAAPSQPNGKEDDSTDDIPLESLRLRSSGAQSPSAADRSARRQKKQDASPFSVMRNKAASNDLEVLDDGLAEGFQLSAIPRPVQSARHAPEQTAELRQPTAHTTPPALPRARTSSLPSAVQSQAQSQAQPGIADDMPLSPSGSVASLSRSRLPRTTSLASPGGPQSPSHQVSRSEDLGHAAGPITPTSQKHRRKLASSRRISSSVDI